jgi:hypothetical protein
MRNLPQRQEREDHFLQQVACLQPISEACLHRAIDAAAHRVVLRVASHLDVERVAHGIRPSFTVNVRGGQSLYVVFEK